MIRSTHTYAVLEISQSAWDEIADRLRLATGYGHVFVDAKTLDMHGISLQPTGVAPLVATVPRSELCYERPSSERIDDILKNRKYDAEHLFLRYEARRNYLQLCCEVDYLRAEIAARGNV